MSQPICRHCAAGVQLFKGCHKLPAGTVMQRCRLFKQCWNLPAGHCVARVQAVYAVSEPTSPALWCGLFKWGLNLPPWHCRAGMQVVFLSGVSFYLLSRLDGQNWIYCSTFILGLIR